MNILVKAIKHASTITKHKWVVFKLSVKAGIPFRGLMHDLSKYSPVEFFESMKYYQGNKSPIPVCKKEKGYSLAWLHHKGKNKHHYQYWQDVIDGETKGIIIPYKYSVEIVCDSLAAGMVYKGKEWTKEYQLDYWKKEDSKDTTIIHPKIEGFLTTIFTEVSEQGIDKVINKRHLKETYCRIVKDYINV